MTVNGHRGIARAKALGRRYWEVALSRMCAIACTGVRSRVAFAAAESGAGESRFAVWFYWSQLFAG